MGDVRTDERRLLIIGNPQSFHVGAHLHRAASSIGIESQLLDVRQAFAAPWLLRAINWHLRGRRPAHLERFGEQVLIACRTLRPQWILTTGIAPLNAQTLIELGALGISRLNYLTDDPWNPAHRASWFLDALPHYDIVFSPRRSLIQDLHGNKCQSVQYLPFAYDPTLHFPDPTAYPQDSEIDVLFIGGADSDRIPMIERLVSAGIEITLYGGYWDKVADLKSCSYGHADLQTMRRATTTAKVSLCLVRRANRDGHVMRSFEIPAMEGCMLAEDTQEHRAIFGEEGQAVLYFRDIPEMVTKLKWLLAHDEERARLASTAHQLITGGKHTYRDRLETMLGIVGVKLEA